MNLFAFDNIEIYFQPFAKCIKTKEEESDKVLQQINWFILDCYHVLVLSMSLTHELGWLK